MTALSLVRLLLLLLTALPAAAAPVARPRGVILVSVDALRADRLGKAPKLSRFAATGVNFRGAVAQAPWTLPSMGTVFTAVMPGRHWLKNRYISAGVSETGFAGLGFRSPDIARLRPEIRTLAEAFHDAGFDTAAFTGDAGLDKAYGFARGFDVYYDSQPFAGFETTAPQALDWLARRGDKPFFLFVHGYDAHGQFQGQESGRAQEYRDLRRAHLEGRMPALTAEQKAAWAARYDEQVALADERVGAFLEAAARLPGLSTGVVVAVMSDHGGELFERGGIDHGPTLYDEALRVVLAISGPGIAPRTVDDQVRLMDLAPTLLDFAGVGDERFGAQAQGVSLRPAMNGERQTLDAAAETDYLYRYSKVAFRSAQGRKLILDLESLAAEVYDLRADPDEKRNLALSDPTAATDLEAQLRGTLGVAPAGSSPQDAGRPTATPSPDLRTHAERLRRAGRYQEAVGLYEKARRVDPEGLQDYLVQGYSRMASGDVAGATRLFDAAVELSSGSPMMRHHRAVQLYKLGRDEEALKEIRLVARAFKTDPAYHGDYLHALMWEALVSGRGIDKENDHELAADLRDVAKQVPIMRGFYFYKAMSLLKAGASAAQVEEICAISRICDRHNRRRLENAAAGRLPSRDEVWGELRRFRAKPIAIPAPKHENATTSKAFECMVRFTFTGGLLEQFERLGDEKGYEAALDETMKYAYCVPGRAALLHEAVSRRRAAQGRNEEALVHREAAARLYDQLEEPEKAARLRAR